MDAHGLIHGAFCTACCWALMLIQLALGIMDVLVMIAVALVIALEKLLPRGLAVARVTGVLAVAGGLCSPPERWLNDCWAAATH